MSPVKIPLRARSGEVRAFALVDADMAPRVVGYRWYLGSHGYAVRNAASAAGKQTSAYLHRQLLGVLGDRSVEVDHLNGDRLDNGLKNLRVVSCGANAQNRNFDNKGTSRFRGVSWQKNKSGSGAWKAQVKRDGKTHYLGLFDSELAAAQVAEAFRLEHMPFASPDSELLTYYEEQA